MGSVSTRAATDDTALVAASRAGGIDAFGRIVERYQNLVCAVAYSNTGDRFLSEDIGQETFLTAWDKLDTVQEPDKLRSWLCSIARNLSSKAVRVRKREKLSDTETLDRTPGAGPSPLAAALTKETEATVWQALEELPESFREPLVLFYRENKSIKQVAIGLGLSEDTAKQRLSRGRQALKEGVSHLVEQTLQSSRPTKAFTAAVLGLIGAAAAPGSAAAAQTTAKISTSVGSTAALGISKLLWFGLAALVLLALVVGVVATRSSSSSSEPDNQETAVNDNSKNKADRAILAALHKRHAAATDAQAVSCEFHGKVVDSDGEVVPGASVAISKDSMQSGALDPSAINAEADGSWNFGPVPRGVYLVSITAPGHLPQTRMERCDGTSGGVRSIEAPLKTGGTRLFGTVADIGGGPVGDVTLWLFPTLGQTGAAITTRTNGEGVYDLSVHPDRYMIVVVHPDYVLDARPVLVSGESAQENFVVLPGAIIEGTVVDHSGLRIARAKVSTGGLSFGKINRPEWVFSSMFGAMFPVLTDDQGAFRLTGLRPGSTQVHARTSSLVSRSPVQADLAIAETEAGVEVILAEAFKVSGFVFDGDEGMANVNVIVQPDGTVTTPNFATTDDSGYFEIAGLVPGNYRVLAVGGRAAPLLMEEVLSISDSDIEDVLVRAKIGKVVSGQIVPSGRASVRLEPVSYESDEAGLLAYTTASMARAEVDETGKFRFPSVADGAYVVVVSTIDGEGRTPVMVEGDEVKNLSVNVTRLASIEGRVVDDTGAPLVGALVGAKPTRVSALKAYAMLLHTEDRTDREGRFEIVGLHPATYEIRVFDDKGQREWAVADDRDAAFEPQIVEVSGSAATLELSVSSKDRNVEGVVVTGDGTPIEDAWVEVKAASSRDAPAGHKYMPALTDEAGRFEIHGLFGDEFEVRATGPRGKLQSARVKTSGDEPVTLTLSTLSIVLATVKRDGKLVEDFEVAVSDGPSTVYTRMIEKKNGTFELPRLISGDYKIEVKSGDSYVQTVVSVGPAPTTSIELQLQPTSSVRGRVVDAHDAPLKDARIIVFGVVLRVDGPANPAGIAVGDDGSFEVRGLTAGSGFILVLRSAGEYDPIAHIDFELKPGQALDLGIVKRDKRQSLSDLPFVDTSEDLGIRFFTGTNPPSSKQLREIDEAGDPRSLLETDGASLWIATVKTGSPAEKSGLRAGDSVIAVGQMQIGDDLPPSEAMISLSQRWRSKGRAVAWVVERDGHQLTLPVVVPQ